MRVSLKVVLAAASVAACAHGPSLADREDLQCQQWGAAPGTPQYAECRSSLYQARVQRGLAFMAGMQAARPAPVTFTPIVPGPPVTQGRAGLLCFKQGEAISGLSKICAYDCAGSPGVTTVGVAELCPLNMTR